MRAKTREKDKQKSKNSDWSQGKQHEIMQWWHKLVKFIYLG